MRPIAALALGCFVVTAAACSGGGGGGGGGGACNWQRDDEDHAAAFLGTGVVGGGTSVVSNSSLTLSFDGTLAPGEMAAIYSKGSLEGSYGVRVSLLEVATTTTGVGAVFALQSGYHGLSWIVAGLPEGELEIIESNGHDQEHWDVYRNGIGTPPRIDIFAERDGFDTIYGIDLNGNGGGNGNYAGITSPLVVGFGFQNVSDPPVTVTGAISATFTSVAIVDSASNCFAGGLE